MLESLISALNLPMQTISLVEICETSSAAGNMYKMMLYQSLKMGLVKRLHMIQLKVVQIRYHQTRDLNQAYTSAIDNHDNITSKQARYKVIFVTCPSPLEKK